MPRLPRVPLVAPAARRPPVRFEVDHLTVRHVGRRRPALQDLSLRWEPGERLLLLGPSGAGKSTLALCLNGIIPHSLEAHWEGGRVLAGGQDTRTLPLGALTRLAGVVFQDPESQLVMLEVDDEIAFGLENLGLPRAEMVERVRQAREVVALDPNRTPARLDFLSGGAKQRTVLAAVLAMAPPALILDEPTANLDPSGAQQVLGAVERLCADAGRSLLLIEHRLDDVLRLVDRVAVLDEHGHLALEGGPDAVFTRHAAELERLGVWTPQFAGLARLLAPGAQSLPRDQSDAAALVVRHWPAGHLRRVDGPSEAHAAAPTSLPGGAALRLHGAGYRYRGSAFAALHDVSLDVRVGERLAVVGANASGKTTLGLLLAGILQPTTGAVTLDGRGLRRLPAAQLRRRLAYVFQYPEHQFVARTVRAELLYGLRARGLPAGEATRRADEALDRFGLAALAEASPHLLSHGQKRRLSVATALVVEPEVLVLDEPTFGQDRAHTEALMALVDGLHRQGRSIVLITHDMTLVAEHADRVAALSAGRLVFAGAPRDLFSRQDVLARCGLAQPPVAAAFSLARRQRADIPDLISLAEVQAALGERRMKSEQ